MEIDNLFKNGYIILPSLISSETCVKLKNYLDNNFNENLPYNYFEGHYQINLPKNLLKFQKKLFLMKKYII